ncbi:hypothetical protein [Embleya scabrispora]|uniref:hypothetical protein n=1 Tax=Embleya scabrispora TaxID=159449 RepID=UPI000368B503|nr:hypothetical protein [Embleya scabrispora]MYS86313.1 hypothetical protein [Streptomyces sp. SID5474]
MTTPQETPQDSPEESTVRLPTANEVGTVRLTPAALAATLHAPEPVTPGATVRRPHADEIGTVRLTPAALAATLHAPEPVAPGSEEAPRFGPGVPALTNTTDGRVASVWHGTVSPGPRPQDVPRRRRPRRGVLGGWLLPAVVLIAVAAYLAWQRYAPALAVTGATVHTDAAGPACDGTATVIGTLHTNGREGTVTYRWKRSDGTVSDIFRQRVAQDAHRTDVVLRWTFDGHGTVRATATLEILSPDPADASATFTYACP